jgi:hypothetical protein
MMMGIEGTGLRLVEDEIERHYLQSLWEFSKHYGIPMIFTGRVCENVFAKDQVSVGSKDSVAFVPLSELDAEIKGLEIA